MITNKMITCEQHEYIFGRHGLICRLKFSGIYPPGSEGTPDARFMKEKTDEVIQKIRPDGLVFDFTDLSYRWGDGILSILLIPLYLREKVSAPSYIVATGETFSAIRNLLEGSGIDSLLKVKMAETLEEALDDLVKILIPNSLK